LISFFFHFRGSPRSFLSESSRSDSSDEESIEVGKSTKHGKIKRGLGKISNMFHRSPRKNQSPEVWSEELFTTPRSNLRPLGEKTVSVNIVIDEDSKGEIKENDPDCEEPDVETCIKSEIDNVDKGNFRRKAKDIVKNAGRNALRKLSDKRLDKNSEEKLSRDDYEDDALSRCSDVSKEVSKESTLGRVEGSPISVHELTSTRGDILLNKSEDPN
jgi:hypothetical protein